MSCLVATKAESLSSGRRTGSIPVGKTLPPYIGDKMKYVPGHSSMDEQAMETVISNGKFLLERANAVLHMYPQLQEYRDALVSMQEYAEKAKLNGHFPDSDP